MPIPDNDTEKTKYMEADAETREGQEQYAQESSQRLKPARRLGRGSAKPFRPIILGLAVLFLITSIKLSAQFEGSISLGAGYSDNVFQLSENDLGRFDDHNPTLDFAETTDDLSLKANVDLAYPIHYKWWVFTPSVSTTFTQFLKNQEKSKRNALLRMRVDRYYWNLSALYGYYPDTYVRNYTDSDGTGESEKYSYERDLWRADLNIKALRNTTLRLNGKFENYLYNQYFTEFDAEATTWGIGLRHNFPIFSLQADYYYRVLENLKDQGFAHADASYESNKYSGLIRIRKMLLDDAKPKGAAWQPSLQIAYEERFFQGLDSWYGGRIDKIYTTTASLDFDLAKNWNINLDYSHVFRNIDSPSAAVRRAKEYSENRLSAAVNYEF